MDVAEGDHCALRRRQTLDRVSDHPQSLGTEEPLLVFDQVWVDPADPSRHLTESGFLIFLDLFGLGFGAFGLVGIGGVFLYMLFPKNDRLRRFAARVGSIDAREALTRR